MTHAIAIMAVAARTKFAIASAKQAPSTPSGMISGKARTCMYLSLALGVR